MDPYDWRRPGAQHLCFGLCEARVEPAAGAKRFASNLLSPGSRAARTWSCYRSLLTAAPRPASRAPAGPRAAAAVVSWISKLEWDLHLIIATSSTSAVIKQQSGRHTTQHPGHGLLITLACTLQLCKIKSLLKFQMNWLQQCNSNTIGWEWILWHSSPESPLLTTYSFPISQICKIHCHQKRQHLAVSVRPASDVVTPRTCEWVDLVWGFWYLVINCKEISIDQYNE